jgi:XTP/dITP diphosphohydrolase
MRRKFTGNRLLVATHNLGKLQEIQALVEPYGVVCTGAAEIGLPVPDETETNFVGNARIKAHAAATAAGMPALADDSGLSVAALDGAPGVHTADWAETGSGRDFAMAMLRVHAELAARGAAEPHEATFVCTLVLAWPDGHDEVFEGRVEGAVVWPPRGDLGHGYDPIFVPGGETRSFAEIDRWEKNRHSHRGRAAAALLEGCFT